MADVRDRWFQRGIEIDTLRARVKELEAKLKVAEEALVTVSFAAREGGPVFERDACITQVRAALAKIKEPT